MKKTITENANGLANKIIKRYSVNISEIQKYNSTCSSGKYHSVQCNHATNYFCKSQGFSTGFPITDFNPPGVGFYCIK